MYHDTPWQVFADNGEAIVGKYATKDEFAVSPHLGMGASHVWVWRKRGDLVEVLLQRRAPDKKTWPDYIDISAAGHIDAGESAVESAAREAQEEIGLTIDSRKLKLIFCIRTPLDRREVDWVFLYQITDEVAFRFDDGEVADVAWFSLAELKEMAKNPEHYKLVPQGNAYFELLFDNIEAILG